MYDETTVPPLPADEELCAESEHQSNWPVNVIACALLLFLLVLTGSTIWNEFRHYPVPKPEVITITCHAATGCTSAVTGG